MNKTIAFIFTILVLGVFGQKNPSDLARPIVEEGKLLYRSEMASWYGTDVFLANYKDRANIGGYFSYTANDTSKCVFFSKSEKPLVIGTISFDTTYNVKSAKVDLSERKFSKNENELYLIRKAAFAEMSSDTIFKTYNNTQLNLIPLINGKDKKVYVLTGPQQSGVVIFGNDYLLTFNKDNKHIHTKQLHKNIIPISYGNEEGNDLKAESTIHSHLPETGDFITATDICTLMLYEKFAKWKTHNVVSKKYLNSWNCETNELTIIPIDTLKKTEKDQEKRENEK